MTAAPEGGEWSAARPGRTLPRERPGTHFTGGWVGGKSRPHRDSIPDRPARSPSLYRLSYSDRPVSFKNPIIIHMTSDPQLHHESPN